MDRRNLDTVAAVSYSFSFQSVIIDMKAMLNNAIKGDYIAAETDPSVSEVSTTMKCVIPENIHSDPMDSSGKGVSKPNFLKKNTHQTGISRGVGG